MMAKPLLQHIIHVLYAGIFILLGLPVNVCTCKCTCIYVTFRTVLENHIIGLTLNFDITSNLYTSTCYDKTSNLHLHVHVYVFIRLS